MGKKLAGKKNGGSGKKGVGKKLDDGGVKLELKPLGYVSSSCLWTIRTTASLMIYPAA